jgi:hypothetical protein
VEQGTNETGIWFSSPKERSLPDVAELLWLFRAASSPLLKGATGAFQISGQGRKTNRTEDKRIAYLLNLKDIGIVQADRVWYWL